MEAHAGRRYVVTGAASGIGAATVTALTEAGARVVAVDLAWDDLAGGGDRVERVALDVADREQWAELAARLEDASAADAASGPAPVGRSR